MLAELVAMGLGRDVNAASRAVRQAIAEQLNSRDRILQRAVDTLLGS